MKGCASPKLLPECIFTLKTALKFSRKKQRKIANNFETAGNTTRSSKFTPETLLLGVPQGLIRGIKLYRKIIFVQN